MFALCFGGTDAEAKSISSMGGVDGPERTYRAVQLLETKQIRMKTKLIFTESLGRFE